MAVTNEPFDVSTRHFVQRQIIHKHTYKFYMNHLLYVTSYKHSNGFKL